MTGDLNKELAEVLREMRRASKHRSQLLFGIAVGLSRSYISKIECNGSSPTAEVLFAMAEQLEVPLSEIIRRAEERLKERKDMKKK